MGSSWVRAALLGGLVACFMGALALGAPSFRQVPPTYGAYLLRGGEWQIGLAGSFTLASPAPSSSVESSIDYGLAPWLQLGLGVAYGGAGTPPAQYVSYSASGKLGLISGAPVALAVPATISFSDTTFGLSFELISTGFLASLRMGDWTAHGAITVGLTRLGTFLGADLALDYDLLPQWKVGAKLGLGLPGGI